GLGGRPLEQHQGLRVRLRRDFVAHEGQADFLRQHLRLPRVGVHVECRDGDGDVQGPHAASLPPREGSCRARTTPVRVRARMLATLTGWVGRSAGRAAAKIPPMTERGERPESPSTRMGDAMCRPYEKGRVVFSWRGKTYFVGYFD